MTQQFFFSGDIISGNTEILERKYSEKSEIFICLDPCILNRFLLFGPCLDLYQSFYRLPC